MAWCALHHITNCIICHEREEAGDHTVAWEEEE